MPPAPNRCRPPAPRLACQNLLAHCFHSPHRSRCPHRSPVGPAAARKSPVYAARRAAEHPAAQDIFHLYPPAVIACGWLLRPPVPDPPGKNCSTPLPAVPPHQAHLALGSRSPLPCRRWRATLHLRTGRQSLQLGPAARAAAALSARHPTPAPCPLSAPARSAGGRSPVWATVWGMSYRSQEVTLYSPSSR